VCGSDGKSYGNACQMKEEACRKQVILEERPMDNCEGLLLSTKFTSRIHSFVDNLDLTKVKAFEQQKD